MLSTLSSWLPPANGILPYYMCLVRPNQPPLNPQFPPSS